MTTTPAALALSYRRVFVCATTRSVYEFLGRRTSSSLVGGSIRVTIHEPGGVVSAVTSKRMLATAISHPNGRSRNDSRTITGHTTADATMRNNETGASGLENTARKAASKLTSSDTMPAILTQPAD